MDEIVNRVANSELIQIDLDDFVPKEAILGYDLAQNLYEGLILKEKDFRDFLKTHNWSQYQNKIVAVFCTADAIIPNWAYMLVSVQLTSAGARSYYGTPELAVQYIMADKIASLNLNDYQGKKVLIKGCGSMEASPEIYMMVTNRLQSVAQSIMFGEACSTVPVFKKKV